MSEGDFDLWQEVLRMGFMKVTSRSVGNIGFLGENPNGSSVNGKSENWEVVWTQYVDA